MNLGVLITNLRDLSTIKFYPLAEFIIGVYIVLIYLICVYIYVFELSFGAFQPIKSFLFGVILWNLDWGLPHVPHPKEKYLVKL